MPIENHFGTDLPLAVDVSSPTAQTIAVIPRNRPMLPHRRSCFLHRRAIASCLSNSDSSSAFLRRHSNLGYWLITAADIWMSRLYLSLSSFDVELLFVIFPSSFGQFPLSTFVILRHLTALMGNHVTLANRGGHQCMASRGRTMALQAICKSINQAFSLNHSNEIQPLSSSSM